MRELLERRFAQIGARLQIEEAPWLGEPRIDIRADRRGEYFHIRFESRRPTRLELLVADASKADRHLLLLARGEELTSRFLCGFDERHWFVAAVPESAPGVAGVRAAKLALQPELVREAVKRARPKRPLDRRNRAYIRQGEWFFVPAPPGFRVDERLVLRSEPLRRDRGSAHRLELAYRTGGRTVYVNRRTFAVLDLAEFQRLGNVERRPELWETMIRDPELYAKGAVSHRDHRTVVLRDWHRVLMNTESEARAMRHVVFLD
jgi:hypothetical protein